MTVYFTISWGPMYFRVNNTAILPVSNFSSSLSLKSDSGNDTSDPAQTNVRGRDLQKVTFSTTYAIAAGVDPRTKIEEWDKLLGSAHPLYVGPKRFGPSKMLLTNIDITDVALSNSGTFLKATVNLTFEEYADGSSTSVNVEQDIVTDEAKVGGKAPPVISRADKNAKKI